MEALLFVVGLIIVNLAATRWGADSREVFRSREWERRRLWRAQRVY